jgi:hypothetical protein
MRVTVCTLKTGSKLRVKLRYPQTGETRPSDRLTVNLNPSEDAGGEGRWQSSESAVTCYIRWQTDSSWLHADSFIYLPLCSPPVGEPFREKSWLVCPTLCGTVLYGNLWDRSVLVYIVITKFPWRFQNVTFCGWSHVHYPSRLHSTASSSLLEEEGHTSIQVYCRKRRVWNLVCHVKGSLWEQGAEENIWTEGGNCVVRISIICTPRHIML